MKFKTKSFPRPVIGNGDDVAASFQTPHKVTSTGKTIEIVFNFQNSSKSLASRILRGEAAYAVHLECSCTFFRNCYESRSNELKISIPRTEIYGSMEGVAVVVAKKEIKNYKIPQSHNDYGDRSFTVEPGDILAISDAFDFDVDISNDDLRKISSIMVIGVDKKRNEGELDINWHGHKIKIVMPERDFEQYRLLCSNSYAQSILGMVVVVPVLTEAVRLAVSSDSEFEDFRWWRCINRRIKDLNIDNKEEPFKIAQLIIANPISRCLSKCTKAFEISD